MQPFVTSIIKNRIVNVTSNAKTKNNFLLFPDFCSNGAIKSEKIALLDCKNNVNARPRKMKKVLFAFSFP